MLYFRWNNEILLMQSQTYVTVLSKIKQFRFMVIFLFFLNSLKYGFPSMVYQNLCGYHFVFLYKASDIQLQCSFMLTISLSKLVELWGKGSQVQSQLLGSEWTNLTLFLAVHFATMEPVLNAECKHLFAFQNLCL